MNNNDMSSVLNPKPKVTFRLLHQGEIALGPGKAELLETIDKTGSISAAGKAMGMSYRRAWVLVDLMNRCFSQPLVQTAKGGQHGGGTRLTPFGRQVLEKYQHATVAINDIVQAYMPVFAGLMNPDFNQQEQPPFEEDMEKSPE